MTNRWQSVVSWSALVIAACSIVQVVAVLRLITVLGEPVPVNVKNAKLEAAAPAVSLDFTNMGPIPVEVQNAKIPVVIAGQQKSLFINTNTPLNVNVRDWPSSELDINLRNHYIVERDPIPVRVVE